MKLKSEMLLQVLYCSGLSTGYLHCLNCLGTDNAVVKPTFGCLLTSVFKLRQGSSPKFGLRYMLVAMLAVTWCGSDSRLSLKCTC